MKSGFQVGLKSVKTQQSVDAVCGNTLLANHVQGYKFPNREMLHKNVGASFVLH